MSFITLRYEYPWSLTEPTKDGSMPSLLEYFKNGFVGSESSFTWQKYEVSSDSLKFMNTPTYQLFPSGKANSGKGDSSNP